MLSPDQRSESFFTEVIQIQDEYYIKASSSLADKRTHVLKRNEVFSVFDRFGDFHPIGLGEQGLYLGNTRFLHRFEIRFFSRPLLLLSSNPEIDKYLLRIDLTNPDIFTNELLLMERDSLHIARTLFLWENTCYQKFIIKNYSLNSLPCEISFFYGADFADIFEVRGIKRERRGFQESPEVYGSSAKLTYTGLDDVRRETVLDFSPTPAQLTSNRATYSFFVDSHQTSEINIAISCNEVVPSPQHSVISLHNAYTSLEREANKKKVHIESSNPQFNKWVNASLSDLTMMITETSNGPYPYAGVPWFSTAFGRDGIITAMQMLWLDPSIAKGVLSFLAHTQAKDLSFERDAEPGKIIHETRTGEMANLKEVPFGLYYGSVDSTPLFIMLADAYFTRTHDRNLIEDLWPSIKLAIEWVDKYGDADHDGFLEYVRHTDRGLMQQGWKDSNNSVFYADGNLAKMPIALCEIQAYAYGAYIAGSNLAELLGEEKLSQQLGKKAANLKKLFNEKFWCPDLKTYALALDGDKVLCKVKSSNAGQCLFTGIVDEDKAKLVAESLFEPSMFSGWGIRTLSDTERRYNPMSYHNGSIWPHDNSIIAWGLKRYGFRQESAKLLSSFFDASTMFPFHRLPELFCGFPRLPLEGPTPYPLACVPQAWADGAVFAFLYACLGVHFDKHSTSMHFKHPILPDFLDWLVIRNVNLGKDLCAIEFKRFHDQVAINLLEGTENCEIRIE